MPHVGIISAILIGAYERVKLYAWLSQGLCIEVRERCKDDTHASAETRDQHRRNPVPIASRSTFFPGIHLAPRARSC